MPEMRGNNIHQLALARAVSDLFSQGKRLTSGTSIGSDQRQLQTQRKRTRLLAPSILCIPETGVVVVQKGSRSPGGCYSIGVEPPSPSMILEGCCCVPQQRSDDRLRFSPDEIAG